MVYLPEQINKPRKTSISGAPLRSARDISLAVHCRIGSTKWSKHLSLMTFQTGQHVDHDVIGTPAETCKLSISKRYESCVTLTWFNLAPSMHSGRCRPGKYLPCSFIKCIKAMADKQRPFMRNEA